MLIINTFEKWHEGDFGKTREVYSDYTEVIKKSDVENQLGRFLEKMHKNLLTMETLPILDLGDKPTSYDPKVSEGGQIFIVPRSSYPHKVIFKYGEYKPEFIVKNLSKKYKKSLLSE